MISTALPCPGPDTGNLPDTSSWRGHAIQREILAR
jgi:hypothetical protein